jgi:hypothetical protein
MVSNQLKPFLGGIGAIESFSKALELKQFFTLSIFVIPAKIPAPLTTNILLNAIPRRSL